MYIKNLNSKKTSYLNDNIYDLFLFLVFVVRYIVAQNLAPRRHNLFLNAKLFS